MAGKTGKRIVKAARSAVAKSSRHGESRVPGGAGLFKYTGRGFNNCKILWLAALRARYVVAELKLARAPLHVIRELLAGAISREIV